MVARLGAAPSICRSGGCADGAPRFLGGRYRVTRSSSQARRIAVFLARDVEMAACAGIAPATFRSTGGCSS